MNFKDKTIAEMVKESGFTRKSIDQRLKKAGIVPRYEIREGRTVAVYRVDETFLRKTADLVAYWRARGYVSADDIAARNRISAVSVRCKLQSAGVYPAVICNNSYHLYKDTPEIDGIVIRKRVLPPRGKTARKAEPASPMDIIIEEERRKKAWVGRRGRLVVDGHVVAEGVIESVSSCGVYLEGSNVKGDLNELELSEPAG